MVISPLQLYNAAMSKSKPAKSSAKNPPKYVPMSGHAVPGRIEAGPGHHSSTTGSAAHIQAQSQLVREVTSLTQEVQKLKDMELIQIFKHPLKFLWFSFLKGVMVGFGSVLGASLVVGIFLYLLTQISLVPVIGDFVQKVIDQIQPGTEQQEEVPAKQPSSQPSSQPSPQSSPQTSTPNPSQK